MRVALVYVNNERNVGRGAGSIMASVLGAGHEGVFFDTYFVSAENVADRVAAGRFDVLMVSSMTMLFPEAVRLVRLVKRRCGIPVLVGGVHATILGARLLEEHPEIDYLCVGEGESMVADFLARLGTGALLETGNLAYRREGRPASNPLRPAEDLSRLPPFPWHLFPQDAVVQPDSGFLYVNATRGCPFHCSYCANGIYLKHYGKQYLRFRPIDAILRELHHLKRVYHPGLFYFGDEMILSDVESAVKLFQAIRDEVNVPWGCMARVEYMTPQVVRSMADAGCQYVAMGVECGDEPFRRQVLRRAMSNDQIERAFALVKEQGIFVTSFNMIGYPFENDGELTRKTVELNEKIRPDYVQTSIFYPFPGTALYDHCAGKDLIDPGKLARTTDYFKESVLRGVSLHGKLKEINRRLNPNGFRFAVRRRAPPAASPAAAGRRPGAAGRSVLLLAFGGGKPAESLLARARSLAAAGYEVSVVAGLEAPEEVHSQRDGVTMHQYSYACEGRSPRHPSLGRLLAYVPPSHMGLRTFFARIFWMGERLFLGPQARRAFAEGKLAPLAADIVHVRGAEALGLGRRLARRWQAALVYEAVPPESARPAQGDLDAASLVIQGDRSPEQVVEAYARLQAPAESAGAPE